MKNKKAFTLVELLAVIVILAVILIIAIPQIMNTIKETRLKTMEDSAKLIATNAEKDYLAQQTINSNYNAPSIPCSDVAKLSKDYASCTITYNDSGVATVKLKGTNGGKFNGITCTGTKDNMKCKEKVVLPGYSDAVELLTTKYNNGTNSEGLIQTNGTELRYQGSSPNNYTYFNCTDNSNPTSSTCESWRIVGLFDGRVKLVRASSIGNFSWDSSAEDVNAGWGVNQWGPSGTYEGADLMRELNTDYLNSTLSENASWYSGKNNNLTSGNFDKNYVLKDSAQKLIGDAIWNTGGVSRYHDQELTLSYAYAAERGTHGKMCTQGTTGCNDVVERTYTWTGKVGLIYTSDFGYASGNFMCASNMESCFPNWMVNSGWTITPDGNTADYAFYVHSSNYIKSSYVYVDRAVKPSVYLIPDIQMKGSGTTADPYVFAE
ncbi:MAG: prepilin-type N-terminal cleavage/methylation domain-containing protein [Bacilli bacterium]|nr:prepilin-type N-terminal cleavage/methylation domain-containing protein [Bacilli bacterium]